MSKDSHKDQFLGKYVEIKAVWDDKKGLFLDIFDNLVKFGSS